MGYQGPQGGIDGTSESTYGTASVIDGDHARRAKNKEENKRQAQLEADISQNLAHLIPLISMTIDGDPRRIHNLQTTSAQLIKKPGSDRRIYRRYKTDREKLLVDGYQPVALVIFGTSIGEDDQRWDNVLQPMLNMEGSADQGALAKIPDHPFHLSNLAKIQIESDEDELTFGVKIHLNKPNQFQVVVNGVTVEGIACQRVYTYTNGSVIAHGGSAHLQSGMNKLFEEDTIIMQRIFTELLAEYKHSGVEIAFGE